MTYKSYSSKSKEESQEKLSEIIQNNFYTTRQIIHHCKNSGIQGYRLSSDLTPVINHPDVNLSLEDLPNYKLIQYQINELKKSFTYIDRTSSPYTEKGDLTHSRFAEFSPKTTQGWELMGMQEIDKDGYEISDKYIKFDKAPIILRKQNKKIKFKPLDYGLNIHYGQVNEVKQLEQGGNANETNETRI